MKYYTVKKGDTLSGIEKKIGVPKAFRKAMLQINPKIRDPNLIEPGWKLKFPSTFSEVKAISLPKFIVPERKIPKEVFPKWMEKKLKLEQKWTEKKWKEVGTFKKITEPKALKTETIKHYKLTPEFESHIKAVPMRKGIPGEIIVRIKKTAEGPKIVKREEKIDWMGRYYYPGEGPAFTEIITSLPSVVFHETLHAHFFKKRWTPEEFNTAWRVAKKMKGGWRLDNIDDILLSSPYGGKDLNKNPYSLAQERYAWLGESLGGIWGIPQYLETLASPLHKYYKGVIKSVKVKPSPAYRIPRV